MALVRPLKHVSQAHMSKLSKGNVVQTMYGHVHHDDIIGRPKRIYQSYQKGKKVSQDPAAGKFIVTEPTLDEYTSMIKRKAQPIYSMDANTIVFLADIDVDIPESPESPESLEKGPRRYLEAGTGNGSLTLSICTAIHGANALARHYGEVSKRGALLHLIDRNEAHLKMGAWNVCNYKRGRYSEDVEFEVSELPLEWLKGNEYMFHGVFLDLPDPELYLQDIARQMALDATLIVFCPSVTQILKCREVIAEKKVQGDKIDLSLVKTVELPPGNGGGTREWDVNSVLTREKNMKVAICRPKVGSKVVGGGFVGVFKKLSVDGAVEN